MAMKMVAHGRPFSFTERGQDQKSKWDVTFGANRRASLCCASFLISGVGNSLFKSYRPPHHPGRVELRFAQCLSKRFHILVPLPTVRWINGRAHRLTQILGYPEEARGLCVVARADGYPGELFKDESHHFCSV